MAFAILSIALPSGAFGAEVSLRKDSSGEPIVDISGNIQKGDLTKVKKAFAALILSSSGHRNKPLQFHLNTPGGDIEEAIRIGRFAREILATVDSYGKIIIAPGSEDEKLFVKSDEPSWKREDYVVLSPDSSISEEHIVRNYSAGILIFYGAVKRAHRDNSDQRSGFNRRATIPVMGIHRPYFEREIFSKLSPGQAADAYKGLEKTVRSYLLEMGAPQEMIDRMFNRPSTQIELIPAEDFRKYYKPEESFLEEWLIAKCGAIGFGNVLKSSELEDFPQIQREQIASRSADKASLDKPVFYVYPSVKFPQSYIEGIFTKIRAYNGSVHSCREKAVSSHQQEWAKSYR